MILVDTHCHLDLPDFDNDRPLVIERARDAGVQGFVLIAFSPTRWEAALTLAEATPGMVVALGIHPNEADRYDTQVEQRLRQLARHPASSSRHSTKRGQIFSLVRWKFAVAADGSSASLQNLTKLFMSTFRSPMWAMPPHWSRSCQHNSSPTSWQCGAAWIRINHGISPRA
jgi:hypothetical protein